MPRLSPLLMPLNHPRSHYNYHTPRAAKNCIDGKNAQEEGRGCTRWVGDPTLSGSSVGHLCIWDNTTHGLCMVSESLIITRLFPFNFIKFLIRHEWSLDLQRWLARGTPPEGTIGTSRTFIWDKAKSLKSRLKPHYLFRRWSRSIQYVRA